MNNGHMQREIDNIDDLVEAFGGTAKFARWLDVGPSAVSNWRALGDIPRGYHLSIYLEARKRRLRVAPAIFHMSPKQFQAAE